MPPRPLVLEVPWHEPAAAARRLRREGATVLLESALAGGRLGRTSYLAVDPFEILSARAFERGGAGRRPADPPAAGDPFRTLLQAIRRHPLERHPDLPPFQGGAAGWLGYDLLTWLEAVPLPPPDLDLPAMTVGLFDVVLAYDHEARRAWLFSSGLPAPDEEGREERARARLLRFRTAIEGVGVLSETRLAEPVVVTCCFTRRQYEAAVRRVVEYVLAGDVFQVNLAQRFRAPRREDPFTIYLRLRERNPAPFAAFVEIGPVTLVSASPERFLRVREESGAWRTETRPIKGTRPRGKTAARDEGLARELLASEKDRAENVMIVDLLRNDLSRVCRDGSVRVPELLSLESYRTVHHLVSTVVGELAEGKTAIDLLRAAFPGGSITGAPKVRAMEIVTELEPVRRGPYCGAIGWFGFDGGMDSNVAIRTLVAGGGALTFHAGGGIVADSDPGAEYEETLDKARALLDAVGGRP